VNLQQELIDVGGAYRMWGGGGTYVTADMEDRVCSTVWIKVARIKVLWQVYILAVLNFLNKLPEGIIVLFNLWKLFLQYRNLYLIHPSL
jgi:hypothetical protein